MLLKFMKISLNLNPFMQFFTALLTVLFIGLKLTGTVAWPWLWVLSPVIIWPGTYIVFFTILVLLALIIMPKK
jgi:hypothetical protein